MIPSYLLHVPSWYIHPCPYPTCRNLFHKKPIIHDFGEFREWYRGRRHHNRLPCCEWCHAWLQSNTQLARDMVCLFRTVDMDPDIKRIRRLYKAIHRDYERTNTAWVNDIRPLAYWVDFMSQCVFATYKRNRFRYADSRQFAQELGKMALELQTNRPRELYFTMPKLPNVK